MKVFKTILRWIFVALFALCALGWCPSLTSFIFLIGAVVLLPIKQWDELLKKIKLTPLIRGIIAAILFVVAFMVSPETPPATAEKEAALETQNSASADDSDDADDVDDYDSLSEVVVGSWTYAEDRAIMVVYDFNADGTWRMTSEGGSEDYGTYEVIDDSKIVMKGEYDDHEFELFDVSVIYDDNGEKLEPYDPNAMDDDEE